MRDMEDEQETSFCGFKPWRFTNLFYHGKFQIYMYICNIIYMHTYNIKPIIPITQLQRWSVLKYQWSMHKASAIWKFFVATAQPRQTSLKQEERIHEMSDKELKRVDTKCLRFDLYAVFFKTCMLSVIQESWTSAWTSWSQSWLS